VVLDVSGLGRLLGGPQSIGEALASRLVSARAQLSPTARSAERDSDPRCASVAVAPTRIAAMLLSAARSGLTVAIDDEASALAPVRLEVLQQVLADLLGHIILSKDPLRSTSREKDPRASAQALDILERWGLTTLGELAMLPAGTLSARLGQAGIALQRMARGIDDGPLVPDRDVPRFLERIELEWPIEGLEPLAFVLARLLEPLSAALERADRGAAAIHLDLRLVDRTRHERVLQLPAAMREAKVLRTLLVLDLESHPPPAAIDIVTIEVDPAPGRVLQYSLLERARPSPETLATLTARLGALVGESRCGQPVLLDSHGPDAFALRRFAPDERSPRLVPVAIPVPSVSSRTSARVSAAGKRTFSAPVASAFTAGHRLEHAVLRRFRPPIAIRVAIARGRPVHVAIDRRGLPGGAVEQCAGPWRTSGAWWKAAAAEHPQWNRDEWDVALSDGSVCRLFQARDTAQWFLEGIVD
jgi:protein ImuB